MASASRRAILGGALALPVLAAPALAEGIAVMATPDQRAWDRALAAYRAAERAHLAACDALEQVEDAIAAEQPEQPTLVRVHQCPGGKPLTLSWTPTEVRRGSGPTIAMIPSGWRAEKVAELDAYDAAVAALEAKYRLHDALAAQAAACEADADALGRLMATSAPTLEALAEKIRIGVDRFHDSEHHRHLAMIAADAERIAGKAVRHA